MRHVSGTLLVLAFIAAAVPAASATATCFGKAATIVGTEGRDELVGTAGDDVIVGLGGWDHIRGRAGDDLICGGDNRALEGYGEVLRGGEGHDRISGGGGPDDIRGSAGNDFLQGFEGSDLLVGGRGIDILSGGPGDDFFSLGERGDDVYRGGLEETLGDTVTYPGSDGAFRVDLPRGSAHGAGREELSEIENVVAIPSRGDASGAQDILIGDDGPNYLDGGPGADVLRGNGGSDCLGVSEGDDLLRGQGGYDYATGQWGCTETDLLGLLPGGWPTFSLASGVSFDLASDTARGSESGSDILLSIEGAYGSRHDDSFFGDDGDNRFYGRDGQDDLSGGAGDDLLDGGLGTDTADGGDGKDNCVDIEAAVNCD